MRLLSKNKIVEGLLKLGLTMEELSSMFILFENVFELNESERIYPSNKDESLYLLANNIALYKNNKYLIQYNLNNISFKEANEEKNNKDGVITVKGLKDEFKINTCKISDFGLLIPIG